MIQLPALRERLGDIPLLAEHFLAMKAKELGKQITGFSDAAMTALRAYSYPGNARELENIIERAVVLSKSPRIDACDLSQNVVDNNSAMMLPGPHAAAGGPWRIGTYAPMPLRKALEEPEKEIILAALEANNWNRQKTSEQLDINRTTLYKKIKHYGLEEYGAAG